MRQIPSKQTKYFEKCMNYLYEWILFHETEDHIKEVTRQLKEIRFEVFGNEEKF